MDDERLLPRRVHLSFVSPVIKIGLAHVNLRIRIHQSTALIDDAADVVDMTVRDDNGVDVLALETEVLQERDPPAGPRLAPKLFLLGQGMPGFGRGLLMELP